MTLIPITERTQYCFVDCGKEICECRPTNRIEMDKEKTAIQILIEEIDSYVSKIPSSNVIGRVQRGLCGDIKRMAIESLKKEQEQIEKALEHGWFRGKEHGIRFGTMIEGEDRRKDIAQYLQSKYGGESL